MKSTVLPLRCSYPSQHSVTMPVDCRTGEEEANQFLALSPWGYVACTTDTEIGFKWKWYQLQTWSCRTDTPEEDKLHPCDLSTHFVPCIVSSILLPSCFCTMRGSGTRYLPSHIILLSC